jgi:hypothetical protein
LNLESCFFHHRCLFEVFISIISKAEVQMCFAPADEKGFFAALGSDSFDAKAVCSTIDAMEAMASVEEDKTMIMDRIKEEVGINSYNEQIRQFLEQQYKFVALRSRRRQDRHRPKAAGAPMDTRAGGDSSGDAFAEVLKHLRRLDLRLGGMEKKQEEMAKHQQAATLKQEATELEVTRKLGALEKNQHGMMAWDRTTQ